eukprot:scaffold1504_cov417-Prasinococcus_capsulatus_cf.AAC.10
MGQATQSLCVPRVTLTCPQRFQGKRDPELQGKPGFRNPVSPAQDLGLLQVECVMVSPYYGRSRGRMGNDMPIVWTLATGSELACRHVAARLYKRVLGVSCVRHTRQSNDTLCTSTCSMACNCVQPRSAAALRTGGLSPRPPLLLDSFFCHNRCLEGHGT